MRGRVGRGKKESFCFLFGDPTTETGKRRLRLMTKTNDGFKIAEEDLHLRGPGEFLGTRQSGLPEFKLADIVTDAAILKKAKTVAFRKAESEEKKNG
jgi:ATP-dependent DNA helicase RecG